MTAPVPLHRYSYQDYLSHEEASNTKHEFLNGEIYAMAGGTPVHGAIAMNVGAALIAQLRGKGCRVQSSDVRIRVLATGLATYPDVSVVCGHAELDPQSRITITNPILLVEVLSPSTADYDRGEKLEHYKQIPSLREVVLVAHGERMLEVWGRADGGAWSCEQVRAGTAILASVTATLTIDDVYRDELADSA